MEVVGKIKLIGEVQTFGDNGFRKRDIVVITDDQYPQMISVEFHQDKTDLLNNHIVGQDVKISINLRGREWINPQGEAKYFNSIVGWRIESIAQAPVQQEQPPVEEYEPQSSISDDEPDDMPF